MGSEIVKKVTGKITMEELLEGLRRNLYLSMNLGHSMVINIQKNSPDFSDPD